VAAEASAAYCPRPLHRATRLIIVTVPDMNSVKGTVHLFQRKSPAESIWQRDGQPEPAVVGTAGVGWSPAYDHLAKKGEPIKMEGDNRAPAGIFRLAEPFGVKARPLPGFVKIAPGKSFCVADPNSIYYGRIVTQSLAKRVKSSEDMSKVPGLRQGMIVDYPARRGKTKGGSCVFFQVWESEEAGTPGRIALPQERIEALQEWSSKGFTTVAIVTEDSVGRFKGCLPLNTAVSHANQPANMPLPNPRRGAKEQRADLAR
jgi:D-alanyl-D-alanine dipeptidase